MQKKAHQKFIASRSPECENLGTWGEELALLFLQDQGYQLLSKNWRCRLGELDLVFQDGDTLVVVEVKTRRGSYAFDALTYKKRRKLRQLTELYSAQKAWQGPIRIDVIVVLVAPEVRVEHLIAAI